MIASLLLTTLLTVLPSDAPSMAQARRHLDGERWVQAISDYREILAEEPDNGLAWYLLGYCFAGQGDHRSSLECNEKSLQHAGPKASVLYNMACSYEQLSELESAEQRLKQAIHAGYLDFDWIAQDGDLVKTLARGNVPIPEPGQFEHNEGRNGVQMPYALLLPKNYAADREYPAVVFFAAGSGPRASAWTRDQFLDGTTRAQGSMVLLVMAPERGWFTHPTHHALEDLLKKVLREHNVAGKRFHGIGFGNGSNPGQTYAAGMSSGYFESFTQIDGRVASERDSRDLLRKKDLRRHFLMRASNSLGLADARWAQGILKGAGRDASVQVIEEPAGSFPSLQHGVWLEVLGRLQGLKQ